MSFKFEKLEYALEDFNEFIGTIHKNKTPFNVKSLCGGEYKELSPGNVILFLEFYFEAAKRVTYAKILVNNDICRVVVQTPKINNYSRTLCLFRKESYDKHLESLRDDNEES